MLGLARKKANMKGLFFPANIAIFPHSAYTSYMTFFSMERGYYALVLGSGGIIPSYVTLHLNITSEPRIYWYNPGDFDTIVW